MKKVHFITAGAGSGKTFSLTSELVDRIKNGGVSPSEVILTTFTKAAAAEFRQKASKALLNAGLETESLQLAGAKIGTIDSISQSFVEKYWYMLGLSPELNVIADTEVKFFENESLEGIVTKEDLALFEKILKMFHMVKYEDNKTNEDPEFWKAHLKKVIEYAGNYGITDFSTSKSKSYELIDRIFSENVMVDWEYVEGFLAGDGLKILKNIDGVIEKTDYPDADEINALKYSPKSYYMLKSSFANFSNYMAGKNIEGLCDLSKIRRNRVVILSSWPKYIDYCNSALRSREFGNLLKEYVRCIFTLAEKWQGKYAEYKTEHRLIDYADMENMFLKLLSEPKVVADIQSDYKLVMVDEFQDCNPLQIEIFSRLSDIIAERPDGQGQSIWVGDKKQSIYGFRGTDMALVNTVLDKFNSGTDGLTTDNLPDSYRSRKKLVKAANEIFTKVFADETVGLNPKRTMAAEKDDMPETAALVDWEFAATTKTAYYKSLARKVKDMLDGKDEHIKNVVEYEHTAEGYKQLGLREIKAGDIAILSNSNKDVDQIADSLNELGINVNVVEKNLKDFIEVQLLIAILEYCVQKDDYTKAKILYLLDGKSTESIIEEKLSDGLVDKNGTIAKIDAVIENTKGQSLSQMVETIIVELDIWNLVRQWGAVSRRHAHISSFRQVVAGYEEHTRLLSLATSVMDFLNYFSKADVVPEAPYIKDENAVSVITYHKSKGLEWPVVIMDSLNKESLSESDLYKEIFGVGHAASNREEIEREKRGEYITILPDIKAGGSLPEAIAEIVNPLIAPGSDIYERVKAERARLLYVGFTRAKDYLVSTSYSGTRQNNPYGWLKEQGVYSDENVWCAEQEVDKVIVSEPESSESSTITYKRIIMPDFTEKSTLPRYISPSTIHKSGVQVSVSDPKDLGSPMTMDFEDEVMSNVGTCIHDFFAIFDESESKEKSKAKAVLTLIRYGFVNLADKAEELVSSINTFYLYLKETYGTPSEILHELPILDRNDDGQILTGSIDLVWKTANGCVVVDFKNKKNDETATDSAKGYAPQLLSYRNALEKAGEKVSAMILFYPVQSQVVILNNA